MASALLTPVALAQLQPQQQPGPGQIRVDGRILNAPSSVSVDAATQQPFPVPNFREAVRETILALADYARGRNPDALVLTRRGLGLVAKSEREVLLERMARQTLPANRPEPPPALPEGSVYRRYTRTLSGVVIEGQICGGPVASDAYLEMMRGAGLSLLSVEHCDGAEEARTTYQTARSLGIIPHVSTTGPVGRVPSGAPFGENSANIDSLGAARNMLLVDHTTPYATKSDWVLALQATNHDVIVLPPFHGERTPLTTAEVRSLGFKRTGARRLVLGRMHISIARDTDYFWNRDWWVGSPSWLVAPLLTDPGSYEVEYWHPEWQTIIGRTFTGLMDLGFHGVVLEGVDVFKDYETRTPLDRL